jgi:hypothetical protein
MAHHVRNLPDGYLSANCRAILCTYLNERKQCVAARSKNPVQKYPFCSFHELIANELKKNDFESNNQLHYLALSRAYQKEYHSAAVHQKRKQVRKIHLAMSGSSTLPSDKEVNTQLMQQETGLFRQQQLLRQVETDLIEQGQNELIRQQMRQNALIQQQQQREMAKRKASGDIIEAPPAKKPKIDEKLQKQKQEIAEHLREWKNAGEVYSFVFKKDIQPFAGVSPEKTRETLIKVILNSGQHGYTAFKTAFANKNLAPLFVQMVEYNVRLAVDIFMRLIMNKTPFPNLTLLQSEEFLNKILMNYGKLGFDGLHYAFYVNEDLRQIKRQDIQTCFIECSKMGLTPMKYFVYVFCNEETRQSRLP